MIRRILLGGSLIASAGLALAQAPPAPVDDSPATWGTAAGSTTLMAHDFKDRDTGFFVKRYLGATYCEYTPDPVSVVEAFGQVDLPDGAMLSQLQFWGYDVDPVDGLNVSLWESCQAPGLNTPVSSQLASADSFGAIGTYFGFQPLDEHRVNSRDCAYTVRVQFNPGPVACKSTALQLQKVQVSWKRDVAPAPPSATFTDVPTNHMFFQYVQALVASGVTGGCGTGNFCPDAPLTRGQMAVFLAKALGLEWP